MSVETKIAFDNEYIEKFSEGRNEPSWLKSKRLESLNLIDTLELPKPEKTKIDKWNFTQFSHQVAVTPVSSVKELSSDVQKLLGEGNIEHSFIVQQNGQTALSQVNEALASQGVIFTDIKSALEKHSDIVEKHFMKEAVSSGENKLLALHTALVNGGVFIYVPKNVEVKVPLQAVYSVEGKNSGVFNHVLIVAEENSSVTYVENNISENAEEAVANFVAEVYAKAGAKVSFGAVDNFGDGVTAYVVRRGVVGNDARIDWALGQMNDGNTVSENTTDLVGQGSYADSKTVSIGRGSQKQNFATNMVHHGKHSEGYILTHGVMKDEASSIFNGITKIEHGASKSNGEQTERVLMLSEKARGDANPILLIDEDDVTAGHAASVGKIDPLQMFYLMSRGISKQEAERLVIHGFLAPVVDQLPIEAVKERLTDVIERKVK